MTDHPVGYGKPPSSRRFGQPGGNPRGRGRARGSRNVSTIVAEALAEPVAVKVNGRTRKISKLDASLKQLANKAASGDLRAIQLVIALAQGVEAKAEAQAPAAIPLTDADRHVLDLLVERVGRQIEVEGHD